MRGQSEIVPREGAKTPRARDGRGGDARDDARAMGEGNREGGCGKNEPTARSCEYYRRWRARTHRSSLTRGARRARAAATRRRRGEDRIPTSWQTFYTARAWPWRRPRRSARRAECLILGVGARDREGRDIRDREARRGRTAPPVEADASVDGTDSCPSCLASGDRA